MTTKERIIETAVHLFNAFIILLAVSSIAFAGRTKTFSGADRPPSLLKSSWRDVEGWNDDDLRPALGAFLLSCRALKNRPEWEGVCTAALSALPDDPAAVRSFFEERFTPYQLRNPDGSVLGKITGYYVPDLEGSRLRSSRYPHPIYGVPDDLVTVDMRTADSGAKVLKGRIQGGKVVPYYDRSQIGGPETPLSGKEICWVKDPVELFYLHVQGTGRVSLDDGEKIMVRFAEHNGHPFLSVGSLLQEKSGMTGSQLTVAGISNWVAANPEEGKKILETNPRFVFFREDRCDGQAVGALGVPLTPERSLAVDPAHVPLGAPVFLSTRRPGNSAALQRLMVAQDVGGAISGAVRADFFWGIGDDAGELAWRTNSPGKMWVLLPDVP